MNDLFPELHGLIDRGDPRLRMLSTVLEAGEPLARLEASTRSSMWNMQRHWTIQSMRDDNELDAKSRRRGIELRLSHVITTSSSGIPSLVIQKLHNFHLEDGVLHSLALPGGQHRLVDGSRQSYPFILMTKHSR